MPLSSLSSPEASFKRKTALSLISNSTLEPAVTEAHISLIQHIPSSAIHLPLPLRLKNSYHLIIYFFIINVNFVFPKRFKKTFHSQDFTHFLSLLGVEHLYQMPVIYMSVSCL